MHDIYLEIDRPEEEREREREPAQKQNDESTENKEKLCDYLYDSRT